MIKIVKGDDWLLESTMPELTLAMHTLGCFNFMRIGRRFMTKEPSMEQIDCSVTMITPAVITSAVVRFKYGPEWSELKLMRNPGSGILSTLWASGPFVGRRESYEYAIRLLEWLDEREAELR